MGKLYSLNVGSVLCDLISDMTSNTVFSQFPNRYSNGVKFAALLLIKFEGQLHLYQYLHGTACHGCFLSSRGGALWHRHMGSIPLNSCQWENWIFLINLPSAPALDRAFIFFTSSTLCIPYSAVLWNEMATSMNLSPELMESSRKRKKSLLEMTLLSHLTGRERRGAEGESITWASTDVTPPVPARPH